MRNIKTQLLKKKTKKNWNTGWQQQLCNWDDITVDTAPLLQTVRALLDLHLHPTPPPSPTQLTSKSLTDDHQVDVNENSHRLELPEAQLEVQEAVTAEVTQVSHPKVVEPKVTWIDLYVSHGFLAVILLAAVVTYWFP